ncbi:hypothetical protein IGI04_014921, partial [Brassica rapa subsp. trilocularis]
KKSEKRSELARPFLTLLRLLSLCSGVFRAEGLASKSLELPNLSSSLVFHRQSHKFKVLLYTHSPESFRITVNCSCDTEQDQEDTMMVSHPGGRVTACSVRCSILEYLMEMMVIFISPLGSVSLGGGQKYFENLGSTIEEHQPCHFWSTTIGGVTWAIWEVQDIEVTVNYPCVTSCVHG